MVWMQNNIRSPALNVKMLDRLTVYRVSMQKWSDVWRKFGLKRNHSTGKGYTFLIVTHKNATFQRAEAHQNKVLCVIWLT